MRTTDKTKVALLLTSVGVVVVGAGWYRASLELSRVTTVKELANRQIELLRDENADYRMQLMTAKTFEEGYAHALLKQDNGSYAEGFADAKNVFDGSNNYALGYHAAIEQFGLLRQSASQDVKQEEVK